MTTTSLQNFKSFGSPAISNTEYLGISNTSYYIYLSSTELGNQAQISLADVIDGKERIFLENLKSTESCVPSTLQDRKISNEFVPSSGRVQIQQIIDHLNLKIKQQKTRIPIDPYASKRLGLQSYCDYLQGPKIDSTISRKVSNKQKTIFS